MNKTMKWFAVGLLSAGTAAAQTSTITVTDGTGNTYGAANGIAIDFDSSLTPATAPWTPGSLVNGQEYSVDSVSLRPASSTTGGVYLGVYTINSSGAFSGFLGASDNSVDFSTVPSGDFVQFTFSGINVTADNVAGSGSGLLYFGFQSVQTASGNALLTDAMNRIDGFGTYSMQDYGSQVMSYGTITTSRALEYMASVTAIAPVPEPSTLAMLGSGLGILAILRRRKA